MDNCASASATELSNNIRDRRISCAEVLGSDAVEREAEAT